MMMSFFKINKSRGLGFSLIELMIVVVIIGVLAAIVLPAYNTYMLRGKRAEGRVILMDAASKMEKHYGDCFRYGTAIAGARDCGADLVDLCDLFPACNSVTNKYVLTLPTATSTQTSYVLDATPVLPGMDDPECNVLSLKSTGEKCITPAPPFPTAQICSNTDAASAAAVNQCWGR